MGGKINLKFIYFVRSYYGIHPVSFIYVAGMPLDYHL